ncbi:MAG: glycosyltransferase [Gemmatimonadota bacterium]
MRIAILTVGSRGDVQPNAALAASLARAGHETVLAAHEGSEGLVASAGVPFAIMPGGFTAEQRELEKNPAELLRIRMRTALELCRGADAIVYNNLAFFGYDVAERLGILPIRMLFEPEVMTGEFPSVYARAPRTLGRAHNRLTHAIEKLSHWIPVARSVNRARAEVLGLPPLPVWGPHPRMRRERVPVLISASPQLLPRPADWPSRVQVTGYWYLDEGSDPEMPRDLREFLDAGPAPVFVEPGSFRNDVWTQIMRRVLESLLKSGARVVTSWCDPSFPPDAIPEELFLMDRDTRHAAVLPHVRAVVAHGGAGTIHALARAGLPALVISIFPSHAYWGRRIRDRGMGPGPIPFQKATPDRIARGIDDLLSTDAFATRAREIGALVRGERGADLAVRHIERWVTGTSGAFERPVEGRARDLRRAAAGDPRPT